MHFICKDDHIRFVFAFVRNIDVDASTDVRTNAIASHVLSGRGDAGPEMYPSIQKIIWR